MYYNETKGEYWIATSQTALPKYFGRWRQLDSKTDFTYYGDQTITKPVRDFLAESKVGYFASEDY